MAPACPRQKQSTTVDFYIFRNLYILTWRFLKKNLVRFYKPGELTYRGNKLWERKNKNLRWPRPVRDKSNRRLWNSSWLLLTRLFKPRLRPLLLLLPVVPNQNTSNSFGTSPNADFLFSKILNSVCHFKLNQVEVVKVVGGNINHFLTHLFVCNS